LRTQFGERFTRMWRYYLAGAHAGFAAGYLQLFQVTFTRETPDPAPATRPTGMMRTMLEQGVDTAV